MAGLDLLGAALSWPGGMWSSFIKALYTVVGNYGLTIILITLIIKVILIPLDVWQKYSQKVMTSAQSEMAPELAKIQQRYATDKNMLNQKQMDLYKKYHVSPIGNCLAMLVNLVVMSVVLFTLLGAVNKISAFKVEDQFRQLNIVYEQSIDAGKTEEDARADVAYAYHNNKTIKESFLWIRNVWRKDGAESVIPDWKAASKTFTKDFKAEVGLDNEDDAINEAKYNAVMGELIKSEKGWNGYYILTILAVITTFLSTKLMTWQNKSKNKNGIKTEQDIAMQKTGNITQYLMPVIMGVFTIFSSSTFAIYLVISQLLTIGFSFAIDPLANVFVKTHSKNIAKKNAKPEIDYRR